MNKKIGHQFLDNKIQPMRQGYVRVCILTCIFVILCFWDSLWTAHGITAADAPVQKILLAKFDFETNNSISFEPKLPDVKASGRVEIALDGVLPHSGRKCLVSRIKKDAVGKENGFSFKRVFIPQEIEGNRSLIIVLYIRSEVTGQCDLKLRLLEERKTEKGLAFCWSPLNSNTMAVLPLSPEWMRLEFHAPVSSGATAVYLQVQVGDSVTDGKMWIDDISIELESKN